MTSSVLAAKIETWLWEEVSGVLLLSDTLFNNRLVVGLSSGTTLLVKELVAKMLGLDRRPVFVRLFSLWVSSLDFLAELSVIIGESRGLIFVFLSSERELLASSGFCCSSVAFKLELDMVTFSSDELNNDVDDLLVLKMLLVFGLYFSSKLDLSLFSDIFVQHRKTI